MSEHALVAPSSLPVICRCPGSLLLQSAAPPEEESQAAREGTAAHWAAEQILRSFIDPSLQVLIHSDLVGQTAPNGVVVDDEMCESAQVYVDDILYTCTQQGISVRELHIEERTDPIPEIHDLCWGTPDCWAFHVGTRTLYLWDFKHGHKGVEEVENEQLITYSLDALRKVTAGRPLDDHGITVDYRIVQPRCYDGRPAVNQWVVPAVELRAHVNWIQSKVAEALEIGAMCHTGPQCGICEAAGICPALRESTTTVVDVIAMAGVEPPSDDALSYELQVARRAETILKARREALEATLEHRLRSGVRVPGWGLEQGYGKRQWKKGDDEVYALGDILGVDLRDTRPCTPAQADKRLKAAGVDGAVISDYYGKNPTSMRLVYDDGSEARRIFKR
jgi:hypothetical protein